MSDWPGDTEPLPRHVPEDRLAGQLAGHSAEKDARMPILTGYASRRAAGVRMELQRRAETALAASRVEEDERGAAALRGKARGLREAVDLVRALETGGRIGRRRRFWTRDLPPGTDRA